MELPRLQRRHELMHRGEENLTSAAWLRGRGLQPGSLTAGGEKDWVTERNEPATSLVTLFCRRHLNRNNHNEQQVRR